MTYRAIAAAQTTAVRGDLAANTEQHLALATLAADAGATVVVFPELSLTGYELDLASDMAFTTDDERLEPLVEFARERRVTLVVGAPVRRSEDLHLAALWIAADQPPVVYGKHHLSGDEVDLFTPGLHLPLLPIGGGHAALAVCADTGHATHPQAAADAGATTYLVGSLVSGSRLAGEWAALQGYAERHGMAVLFANYGAPSGGLAAQGGSAIWAEDGRLLASIDAPGAGVVVALESASGWDTRVVR